MLFAIWVMVASTAAVVITAEHILTRPRVMCMEGVKWVVDKRGTLNQVIDSNGKGVKCE